MNCLIFGYGYMGKIRYRVLRKHPDVDIIKVIDPEIDPASAELNGILLPRTAEIP